MEIDGFSVDLGPGAPAAPETPPEASPPATDSPPVATQPAETAPATESQPVATQPDAPTFDSDAFQRLLDAAPDDALAQLLLTHPKAKPVVGKEANRRASQTISERDKRIAELQQIEAARKAEDEYDAKLSKALEEHDYDVLEELAKDQHAQRQRQRAYRMLDADPNLKVHYYNQAVKAAVETASREHDYFRDIPDEVWAKATAQTSVPDVFKTLFEATHIPKSALPKLIQAATADAVAKAKDEWNRSLPAPDLGRSEGPPASSGDYSIEQYRRDVREGKEISPEMRDRMVAKIMAGAR